MKQVNEGMTVGFIGLGSMGAPIARRILSSGVTVIVNDISESATKALVDQGARKVTNLKELAETCSIIFLSLPDPAHIEEVVAGASGLLSSAKTGTFIVDLSTNSLKTVRRLHELSAKAGVTFVDAPVSGGVSGANKGTLSVMLGGSSSSVAAISPCLNKFCEHIFHVGDAGAGTVAKLVNNQIFLTGAIAVQEGLTLAKRAGIEESALLEILNSSSAKSYVGLAPLFLARDYDKVTFKLSIASKDIDVALDSARELGVNMLATKAAGEVYHKAIAEGRGEKVFYATLATIDVE